MSCLPSGLALLPPRRYYAYWERRLFSAVNSMVVSGLQAFQARLHACRPPQEAGLDAEPGGSGNGGSSGGGSSPAGRPPLFRAALALLQPEVVVAPSTAEVSKQLGRMLRNLVESAKPFVRWMDATCLEAPEQ